jgi:hypothetical protein
MVFIRGDLTSGSINAGANVTIDCPAAAALQPVLLEVEILLAGQNSHGAYQHDRSPVHVNLDGRSLSAIGFCTGIYIIWQLFRDF